MIAVDTVMVMMMSVTMMMAMAAIIMIAVDTMIHDGDGDADDYTVDDGDDNSDYVYDNKIPPSGVKSGVQAGCEEVIRDLFACFSRDAFRDYADLCYREFGDSVKHWMTLNEPLYYDIFGYAVGNGPPGRCSKWLNLNCTGGKSGTELYTVAHNLILAHAAASKLYKEKYQKSQNGEIGIVLAANWIVPLSKSAHHREAAQRALDFTIGWDLLLLAVLTI